MVVYNFDLNVIINNRSVFVSDRIDRSLRYALEAFMDKHICNCIDDVKNEFQKMIQEYGWKYDCFSGLYSFGARLKYAYPHHHTDHETDYDDINYDELVKFLKFIYLRFNPTHSIDIDLRFSEDIYVFRRIYNNGTTREQWTERSRYDDWFRILLIQVLQNDSHSDSFKKLARYNTCRRIKFKDTDENVMKAVIKDAGLDKIFGVKDNFLRWNWYWDLDAKHMDKHNRFINELCKLYELEYHHTITKIPARSYCLIS